MKLKRFSILAAICMIAGILAVPMAFAQGGNAPRAPVAHPATNPNCSLAPTPGVPFSTVVGTTWVFHWVGIELVEGAVGNMSFISVADPNSQSGQAGFLNVIETRNVLGIGGIFTNASGVFRFLNYNGRFLIFPDCTGGTLMFNSGAPASQEFDFYFRRVGTDPFGGLRMVSIDPNNVEFGEAEKQGPS